MRTRMYGGVRGRKTKVGGKPTFVFLLLDFCGPNNGSNSGNHELHFYTHLNIGVILTETKKTETVPTALPLL